ncbi:hypothetical protein L1987_37160 [Smallanthus sonchifolius]|uniref:Uncharacterized protein n=1 Tax=Smallanthus sonchifolius TaxID=185202 RepID=A0ACB9HF48_9ASTR|nr:hypothetical protein L1987_37160 [Smallanthus sonchifolius]
MAGVDYSQWGMDIEEWERMETGPPPPHLYADVYDQEHKHGRDEDVVMMMKTDATYELCGSTEPKNRLTNDFNEINSNEGGDDFLMQSPKTYNKIMNRGQVEALAMVGVDYNDWGMDFEEWERMQTGPPPPHLYADDYVQDHEYERDEEVIMMMATNATDELLGSTQPKNQLIDVFDERNDEGGDDFLMQLSKTNIKTMNHDGIKRLKMLMVAMMSRNNFSYIILDIMSVSIEALAMAGVDYNEWGMDFEEWERMEMGPPPPHLYADDYDQEHELERDEEVFMMMKKDATELKKPVDRCF